MKSIFDYKDNLHVMDHIPAILKWGSFDGPKPDVSILMPVYNHPHFFKIALETALNQDYNGNYEIIVLDNNMDGDINNVNEFEECIKEKNDKKILYYKNKENIQGLNSFNRLPQLARAEYFTFLHDDDELCSNCISSLIECKERNHLNREIIIPSVSYIDKDSNIISTPHKYNSRDLWGKDYKMTLFDWFQMSYTNGGGCLHHRDSFLKLGGYCYDFIPSADYAFYILYTSKYGAYYCNKILFRYRWAENDLMKVYEDCTSRDYQFRSDMVRFLSLPDWALKLYMRACYRKRLSYSDVKFKGHTTRPEKWHDSYVYRFFVLIKFFLHLFS